MVPVSRSVMTMAVPQLMLFIRFITPVFLHAGIIHYLLNMLAQMTVSAQVSHTVNDNYSRSH